jgi:hypothetical protein
MEIEALQKCGINTADIQKLRSAGICTIRASRIVNMLAL